MPTSRRRGHRPRTALHDDLHVSFTAQSFAPVAVARSTHPLPTLFGTRIRYYELRVDNPGQHCKIGCGVAHEGYPDGNQPGWRADSFGWHGDDAGLFMGEGAAARARAATAGTDGRTLGRLRRRNAWQAVGQGRHYRLRYR
jgi:hypothetical protein